MPSGCDCPGSLLNQQLIGLEKNLCKAKGLKSILWNSCLYFNPVFYDSASLEAGSANCGAGSYYQRELCSHGYCQKSPQSKKKLSLVRVIETAPVNTLFLAVTRILSSLLDLAGWFFPRLLSLCLLSCSSTYSSWKASFNTVLAKNRKSLWHSSIQRHYDKTRIEICSESKSSCYLTCSFSWLAKCWVPLLLIEFFMVKVLSCLFCGKQEACHCICASDVLFPFLFTRSWKGWRVWDIMAASWVLCLFLWRLLTCPFQGECFKTSSDGLSSCKLSFGQVALAFPYSSVGWSITHQNISCRAVQRGRSVSSVHSPRNASVREATKGTCLKRQMSEKRNVLGV